MGHLFPYKMQEGLMLGQITYYNTVIFQKSVGLSRNLSLLLAGLNGVACKEKEITRVSSIMHADL